MQPYTISCVVIKLQLAKLFITDNYCYSALRMIFEPTTAKMNINPSSANDDTITLSYKGVKVYLARTW